ncbi:hypothetical protein QMA02_30155 [Bacillus wiedmannii]|nr:MULTISPECIES: hypothetical protein [Bacillus cereus group]MDI6680025.1 hypothetical protein [Bacillus wiedmannii]MED1383582.1 hypothetical protein [Bacillus mycoides]
MKPLITVPKMDWIPTEFYVILPIFILVLFLVLGIYKQHSTNKSKRNENS